MSRVSLLVTGVALVTAMVAGPVMAVPTLQLYIEGATYDAGSETWVTTSNTFKLWTVGSYNQGAEIIENVRLAAAVYTDELGTGSISLAGSVIGQNGIYNGFSQTPALNAAAPTSNGVSADGYYPVLGDDEGVLGTAIQGSSTLGGHGIYGAGVSFFEWGLGDFTTHNSQSADFALNFPTPHATQTAEIRAYEVDVTGFSGVHFDLYNHIEPSSSAQLNTVFAPFSHDSGVIPEPGSLVLLGSSLMVVAGSLRFRRRRSN